MKDFKWIDVKDELPDKTGFYMVKSIIGSMDKKEYIRKSYGRMYATGFRFLECDWETITHWAKE